MADKEYVVSLLLKLNDALTKPLGNVNQKNAKALKEMGEKWQKVGGTMTKTITAPFLLIAGLAVKTAGDFEKYTQSFSTMLRSQEKGTEFVKDLRDFAARTPLEFKDLASGAETLLAFRIESKNVLPYLKMIGDVARGDAQKMSQLTLAFSQMHSTGRLMGQDLLQMINAGFNPLAVISEKTGKSIGQLKKEMEKGAISTRMVIQAFKDTTSAGGMFYNAMEKQSKTFLGRLSTLKDNLSLMLAKVGELLFPFVNKIMEFVQKFIDFFSQMDDTTKSLLITIIALLAAAGPVINVVGRLIKMFSAGFTPLHGFMIAVAALALALTALTEAASRANKIHEIRAKEIDDEIKDTHKLATRYEELAEKTKLNYEEKHELATIEEILKRRIGETAFEIDKQTGKLKLNNNAVEKYNRMKKAQMVIELAEQRTVISKQIDMLKKYIEMRRESNDLFYLYNKISKEEARLLQGQIQKNLDFMKTQELPRVLDDLILKHQEVQIQISKLSRGEKELTENTDDLAKSFDKLGDAEEKPLLEIPTKLRKAIGSMNVSLTTPKSLEAMAKSRTTVDVTIKVETEKGAQAKVKKASKKGTADVKIKTGSSLDAIKTLEAARGY